MPETNDRVILRDEKGGPRGQHERLSELLAGKKASDFTSQYDIQGTGFKNLHFSQPLSRNEIFPPSTVFLIHNSQNQMQTLR